MIATSLLGWLLRYTNLAVRPHRTSTVRVAIDGEDHLGERFSVTADAQDLTAILATLSDRSATEMPNLTGKVRLRSGRCQRIGARRGMAKFAIAR